MDFDYKTVIIIIVIICFIFFIIHEIKNIHRLTEEKTAYITDYIDNSTKVLKNKIQNDTNVCIEQIKSYNEDLLIQVRKLSYYGSQPIVNRTNYYSENGSMNGNTVPMKYLSDMYNEQNEPNEMNETNEQYKQNDLYISPNEEKFEIENLTQTVQSGKKSSSSSHKKSSRVSRVSRASNLSSVSKAVHNMHKLSNVQNSNNITNNKTNNINIINNNDNVSSIDTNDSSNNTNSSSIEVKTEPTNYESVITFESTKAKQMEKKNISLNDNVSINTKNLDNLTIDNFKSSNTYTLQTLKEIAKRFSISLFYKDGTTRKQYKKDDLYEKIKKHLSKKKIKKQNKSSSEQLSEQSFDKSSKLSKRSTEKSNTSVSKKSVSSNNTETDSISSSHSTRSKNLSKHENSIDTNETEETEETTETDANNETEASDNITVIKKKK